MATGVLPLVLGRATRLAQFFSAGEKTYDARIQFGWSTDTYDREGERTSEPVEPRFTRPELETTLERFRGFVSANASAVFGEKSRRHPGLSIGAQRDTLGACSRSRCKCSSWISWSLTERPPASAYAARPELICVGSRTMPAASLVAEHF